MKKKTLFALAIVSGLWCSGQNNLETTNVSPEYPFQRTDFNEKVEEADENPYVTNVTAKVVNGKYEISYILHAKSTSDIFVYVSYAKGYKWTGPLSEISGDVGVGVDRGFRKIIWDCVNEEGFNTEESSVIFKIVTGYSADEINIDSDVICEMMNRMVEAQLAGDTEKSDDLQELFEPQMEHLQKKYPKGSEAEKKLEVLVKPCVEDAMKRVQTED
jgi:hypothetical protein